MVGSRARRPGAAGRHRGARGCRDVHETLPV